MNLLHCSYNLSIIYNVILRSGERTPRCGENNAQRHVLDAPQGLVNSRKRPGMCCASLGSRSLARDRPRLHAGRCRPAFGLGPDCAHPGRARRRASLAPAGGRGIRPDPRRLHGQPGGPAYPRRAQGDLSFGLAGRGRRELLWPDVSRPVALPRGQRPGGREADQPGLRARRPGAVDGACGRRGIDHGDGRIDGGRTVLIEVGSRRGPAPVSSRAFSCPGISAGPFAPAPCRAWSGPRARRGRSQGNTRPRCPAC